MFRSFFLSLSLSGKDGAGDCMGMGIGGVIFWGGGAAGVFP